MSAMSPNVRDGFIALRSGALRVTNAELVKAFDDRNTSAEANAAWRKHERQILARYEDEARGYAKPIYDPDATADRELVAAAVRGAGHAPAEQTENDYRRGLANMNDTEFAAELARLGV